MFYLILHVITHLLRHPSPPPSPSHRFALAYTHLASYDHPNGNVRHLPTATNISNYLLDIAVRDLQRINRAFFVGASLFAPTTATTVDPSAARLSVYFNNKPYHTMPIALALAHNALLRAHLGADYRISVINAPLPYDTETRIQQVAVAGQLGYTLGLNIAYAMAFVMAFYVLPFVREQANRAKLLQFVSGARVAIYWGTAFVFDYATFALSAALMVASLAPFGEPGWSTGEEIAMVALVLAAFGWAAVPTTHLAARAFSVPTAGYTLMTIVYIFTGLLLATLVHSLDLFGFADTAGVMQLVFMLFPHFSLNECLGNMQNVTQHEQVCRMQCERLVAGIGAPPGTVSCEVEFMCAVWPACCGEFCSGLLAGYQWMTFLCNSFSSRVAHNLFSFTLPGIAKPLTYMAGVGLLAAVVNLLIEYRCFDALWFVVSAGGRRMQTVVPPFGDDVDDADVVEEQHRVNNMSAYEIGAQSLVVREMSKMYGRFCSVNRLSVSVDG